MSHSSGPLTTERRRTPTTSPPRKSKSTRQPWISLLLCAAGFIACGLGRFLLSFLLQGWRLACRRGGCLLPRGGRFAARDPRHAELRDAWASLRDLSRGHEKQQVCGAYSPHRAANVLCLCLALRPRHHHAGLFVESLQCLILLQTTAKHFQQWLWTRRNNSPWLPELPTSASSSSSHTFISRRFTVPT